MTTQSIPITSNARERFLLEIAAVVPPARLAEVHFFPPIRQGPIETGVAVIAAMPEGAELASPTDETAPPEMVEGATLPSRHVVYSARYRWTRKGPERGKWACEIVAEADAPLLTVEAVVQGVRQRLSEPVDAERVEGEALRAQIAEAEKRWPTAP